MIKFESVKRYRIEIENVFTRLVREMRTRKNVGDKGEDKYSDKREKKREREREIVSPLCGTQPLFYLAMAAACFYTHREHRCRATKRQYVYIDAV